MSIRVYVRRNKKGMEVKDMDKEEEEEIGALPKDMPCTSNYEDHSFHTSLEEDHLTEEDPCAVAVAVDVGGGGDSDSGDDASVKEEVGDEDDVDVLGWNDDDDEVEASECYDDGTDDGCSLSSFSGTDSEHESDETSLNDQEADSVICNDTSLPLWVRKRKLTDHWRRFVQPIMWRCKWIELKIKEFQNQALKYDKELEESFQAKKLELGNHKSEEIGIKALPSLPCYTQKTRLRKRKKRKLVEETSDVPSYASNHNIFSYYDCRKSVPDIALNDNSRNQDKRSKSAKDETLFSEETPPLEFREGDAYLEQILLKIEAAKSEARNLKNRVDKVVSENPSRFSPANTVTLLGSADVITTTSEQQKPLLVIKTEDEKSIISEEKPVKSASVSSHHDTPEDDETTDILLSEIVASKRREGKAIVPDKKLQKPEQTTVEEGPSNSRPVRKRIPRNLDGVTKEETKPKRNRVSKEKPKSNVTGVVTGASRFKLPNRKRKRGKRRSGSAGLRRRS
ncbi:PREDICTED: uncharacterized protein LOC104729424 [Camelina sativa]|uniref:Uncharacterized protein LOC104729424 n=1 Tax=Camelina sativa TaxID=90675 RepID=A0ABM0UUS6_CAMSA|nr:PREDICTED: uncharacterized protein LOC104729424 [Camelina sativa]